MERMAGRRLAPVGLEERGRRMDTTRTTARASAPARALALTALALTGALLIAACGGGGGAATPTPEASAAASEGASAAPSASNPSTGEPSIEAADEIEAGQTVEIAWTGPNAQGDYLTIVAKGATEWTDEPYVNADVASPTTLPGPTVEGDFEIWYVAKDGTVLARHPFHVTPFEGDLLAVAEVLGNTKFDVTWNGPNGQGDYITIVAKGTTKWTNENYAYTKDGNPAELLAPLAPGDYEIWYVTGDGVTQATRPITVTSVAVTLEAAATAAAGAPVEIAWTGPNGSGDYLTFAPVGSPEGTYLDYEYTTAGSPVTVNAPAEPGNYEIRYVAGTGATLAAIPIKIT